MKIDDFIVESCAVTDLLPGYLYTDPAFVEWQAKAQGKRLQSFGVFRKDNRQLYAQLTLAGKDHVWGAPVTGAFGGVVLHKYIPAALYDVLLDKVIAWLKSEGAKSCTLRLPPSSFPDAALALMQNALFRCGWKLEQMDINYHLPVVAAEEFHEQLGATKRQETRRLKTNGAQFTCLSSGQGKEVYDVIARNRAGRGYPMTMSWEAIEALTKAFPDAVHFFGVQRAQKLMAGAVGLRLSPNYFYIFYWGEDPLFRKEMPVLLLVDGLVGYCHENGFETLDIGTSTDKSIPNEGLIEFKTGLGFLSSSKLTFRHDF